MNSSSPAGREYRNLVVLFHGMVEPPAIFHITPIEQDPPPSAQDIGRMNFDPAGVLFFGGLPYSIQRLASGFWIIVEELVEDRPDIRAWLSLGLDLGFPDERAQSSEDGNCHRICPFFKILRCPVPEQHQMQLYGEVFDPTGHARGERVSG